PHQSHRRWREGQKIDMEAASDRIAIPKMLPRKLIVDHDDRRRMLIVLRGQETPARERYPHDFEVACFDDIGKSPLHLSRRRWPWLPVEPEGQRAEVARHRYRARAERGRPDAWECFERAGHLPPNRPHLVRARDQIGRASW